MRFAHLAQRLFNRPLAIDPAKAEIIVAALAQRLGIAQLRVVDDGGVRDLSASDMVVIVDDAMSAPQLERRIYEVVDGVAIVPVEGTLVAKLGLDPWSGMTGYDGIRAKVMAAADADDVRAIWLDIDSPGGEVSGLYDLVDEIYALREAKPIWAVLSDTAASAAYAIASAAHRIVVPRTGLVGSIGVITMHVDWSRALDSDGVTVTLIAAGRHKTDGNPFEPLPDAVRADIQADIDTVAALFHETVARNRGLGVDAVRGTEARIYLGPQGVDLGLADAVQSETQAWLDLHSQLRQAA